MSMSTNEGNWAFSIWWDSDSISVASAQMDDWQARFAFRHYQIAAEIEPDFSRGELRRGTGARDEWIPSSNTDLHAFTGKASCQC